jgi:hypothetical protein
MQINNGESEGPVAEYRARVLLNRPDADRKLVD